MMNEKSEMKYAGIEMNPFFNTYQEALEKLTSTDFQLIIENWIFKPL